MRSLYRIIGAILLIYVAAVAVFAQAGYEAQIRGRVTDPAGAVVVGATVTLRDTATNISQSVKRPIRAEVIRSTP
jgi:type 1 fimbria pilin